MSASTQDVYTRVTHAVSKMRTSGASLPHAAQEYGVSRRQMRRFGGKALRKLKNGWYAAKASDRLLRILVIPTRQGLAEITVNDSREASRLGRYSAAVERYLQTGEASALREFRGKHIINASGKRVPLLTDLHELDRQGSAGVLSFESLYARVA